MSGAEITEHDDGFLVTCEPHGLARKVETGQHAANLQALHNRIDHADDTDSIAVDLTAAARELVTRWDALRPTAEAALEVWLALTGITYEDDGLAYARELATADPPITAAIPPF